MCAVADLSAARLRRAWDTLETAARRCAPTRLAAYLTTEDDMSAAHKDPVKAVRLPLSLMDRAGELVPAVKASPLYGPIMRVSTAGVIRLALVKGLDALEAELANPE